MSMWAQNPGTSNPGCQQQFDHLQALHRVRERLVSQRTGIINQIRAFLLERGVAVRYHPLSIEVAIWPT